MRAGLVSVSFRGHTPTEILRAAADSGLFAIEWGSDVHAPADDIPRLRAISAEQSAAGVVCSSYGTYFRVGRHRPEDIYPYIRAAAILGTDTLRIWCGTQASDACDETTRATILRDCRTLTRIAEAEGVTLCTEFHHGTYADRAETVRALCEAASSPCFRTYWQPNQFRTDTENLAAAEALSGLVVNLHVFHWRGNDKFPLSEGVPLWREYRGRLPHAAYALLEFMPDGRIESLPAEAEALREILGAES